MKYLVSHRTYWKLNIYKYTFKVIKDKESYSIEDGVK